MARKPQTTPRKPRRQPQPQKTGAPLGRPTIDVRARVLPGTVTFDPVKKVFRGKANIVQGPVRVEGRDEDWEMNADAISEYIALEETAVGNVIVYAVGEKGVQKFPAHAEGCPRLAIYMGDEPRYIHARTRSDVVTQIYPPHTFGYDPDSEGEIAPFAANVIFDTCLDELE